MLKFEAHLVGPATVFTYKDGRPPWFVLPNVRGALPCCAAPIDEARCLIGSGCDVAIVDVMSQRVLESKRFSKRTFHDLRLVLSKDRKLAVMHSGGFAGIVLIRLDPLTVSVLDRVHFENGACRYLASSDHPTITQRMNSGFYNAGIREDGCIVLITHTGAHYLESVVDPNTGNVEVHTFGDRFSFRVKPWFSPSGRWLLAVREADLEYLPPWPVTNSVTNGDHPFSHPDILPDDRPRWGLQLELWDMSTRCLKRKFSPRYFEERELWHGWLLDSPPGENDIMWRCAKFFGISGSLSESRASQLNAEEVRAYNESRAQVYARERSQAEEWRREYIRKLILMSKNPAQSPHDLLLTEPQRQDLFERIMSVTWFEDERSFAVLFSDGMIREITVDGNVAKSVTLERFQHESWHRLENPHDRPHRPRAGKIEAVGGYSVRTYGYRGNPPFSDMMNQVGYVEVNLTTEDRPKVVATTEDGFVDTSFPDMMKELAEASNAANQYRITLPDLAESSCISAIEQLTSDLKGDLDAILLNGDYDPFFKLPDEVMPEKEFFKHVMTNCPNAVHALRELLTTFLSRWRSAPGIRNGFLWKDSRTEALAYALTALVTLDPNSHGIARRYLGEFSYDCNGYYGYFMVRFFEDVAPSGRWQDPKWLPLAIQHLCADFAGDHWATLGFRQAFMKLSGVRALLDIICTELDPLVRPAAEAKAERRYSTIAERASYRAACIAKGEVIPWTYAIDLDDKPVDVESAVAEEIDEYLATFINSLSTDPVDVSIRAELLALRPSVAEQL